MSYYEVPQPHFGDVFFADLSGDDHVQSGKCPVVIAQNDIGNRFSSTIEVIPLLLLRQHHALFPSHFFEM